MTLGNEQKNLREQMMAFVTREMGVSPIQMTIQLPPEFNQMMAPISDPIRSDKPWRPQNDQGQFPSMPGYDVPFS